MRVVRRTAQSSGALVCRQIYFCSKPTHLVYRTGMYVATDQVRNGNRRSSSPLHASALHRPQLLTAEPLSTSKQSTYIVRQSMFLPGFRRLLAVSQVARNTRAAQPFSFSALSSGVTCTFRDANVSDSFSLAWSSSRSFAYSQRHIRYRSNRSRRGLYNGKDIRSGNNVPFSMKKTKRRFKPNVFKKSVYSEVLDEMVRFHLTASALRSIDNAGGLDNYLLTSRHVTSGEGLATKERILKKMASNAKKAGESDAASA